MSSKTVHRFRCEGCGEETEIETKSLAVRRYCPASGHERWYCRVDPPEHPCKCSDLEAENERFRALIDPLPVDADDNKITLRTKVWICDDGNWSQRTVRMLDGMDESNIRFDDDLPFRVWAKSSDCYTNKPEPASPPQMDLRELRESVGWAPERAAKAGCRILIVQLELERGDWQPSEHVATSLAACFGCEVSVIEGAVAETLRRKAAGLYGVGK